MYNKNYILTYDLLTNVGYEHIEAQFKYFETCIMTLKHLSQHCNIDNITINSIK